MSDKLKYHLSNLLNEVKQTLSDEISASITKALSTRNSNSNTSEILTIEELAVNLKVSKSHINKLRKKHVDFPVLNIAGSVRFRQSEVEKYFTSVQELPKKF